MVMEKPMQLAMVSAEPTSSRGALAALSAENWGESPTTTIPQNSKNARNAGPGAANSSGESTQQMPEARSCAKATGALPERRETSPPAAQPMNPAAITAKLQSETRGSPCAASTTGTKVQNA